MKIFNNPHVQKAMNIYNSSKKGPTEATNKVQQTKDQLQLSEGAKDFQVALNAFKKLPEVREDKVAELRERIQQGTYNVSGKEVADKILEGLRIDKKI